MAKPAFLALLLASAGAISPAASNDLAPALAGPPALRDPPAIDLIPANASPSEAAPVAEGEEDEDEEEDGEEGVFDPDPAAEGKALGVSSDDERPEDQFEARLFGAPLVIGGEIEAAGESLVNGDLDRIRRDLSVQGSPEAAIEMVYQPADNLVAFVQAKAFGDAQIIDAAGPERVRGGVSLDQAWLLWTRRGPLNLGLQIGRQQFEERREWWWDETLDAARLHFAAGRFAGFIAAGETLWDASTLEKRDPDERNLRYLLGNLSFAPAPGGRLDLYLLKLNDHSGAYAPGRILPARAFDEEDADLHWVGARARTRIDLAGAGAVSAIADLAWVGGEETVYEADDAGAGNVEITDAVRGAVSGWAIDAKASWLLPAAFGPVLSFGFARGSGDRNRADLDDRDFRQTGLQGNNDRFRGLSRFEYYGEALRPSLSNIRILTASLGAPIGEAVWIETVYHNYRQVAPRDEIADSRLRIEPLGLDRDIGDEIDFILSFESDDEHWEAELAAGSFRAGDAFGPAKGEWAHSLSAKLNYNF